MKNFIFMAVLALVGLSTPPTASAQGTTPYGEWVFFDALTFDTTCVQEGNPFFIEFNAAAPYTAVLGTVATWTGPTMNGEKISQVQVQLSHPDSNGTFLFQDTIVIPVCVAVFSIDNAVLEAPREAHNSVEISALLINEQGNTSVELLASSNGGEDWFQIAWTRSKGDGDNTYKWVWTTPKAGQYLFQVTVTDINGFAGRSNAVEVYMTADPALIILDNGSQQPRISYDGDLSGVSGLDIVNGAGQVVAQTGPRGEIPALLPPSIYYTRQEVAGRPLRILKR